MAENTERAKLGLRLVKTNWYFYGAQFGDEVWKITRDDYGAKTIHRDANGMVSMEADFYYSGKTFLFPPDKGTEWEQVTISYDYTSKLLTVTYIGMDPSILALFKGDGVIVTITNNMSVADEVLKKWGIPRL